MVITLSFLTTGWAQKTDRSEKTIVQNAVTGLFDGLAELDVEKSKSFCTSDVKILESGAVWNFDSLANRITARKATSGDFKRINQLDFLETTISGDIAWLYYLNQATITSNGKTVIVKWLESVVLKREKSTWKVSLLHSTELERTP